MELPGETFLFNLSLLALTFSAVSALVTLLRQTMGGKLSKFEVYLVNAFVQQGFALAIAAILPPLIAQFELSSPVLWTIASGLAAVVLGWRTAQSLWERMSIIKVPMPLMLKVQFSVDGFAVVLFLLNATVPAIQGIAVFDLALTIGLAEIMWSFGRRISTLLGDRPSDDWDPKLG
jgi:hypothetical protein